MINHDIFEKIKDIESTVMLSVIIAYLLDAVPTVSPCIQHMVIDDESLVKVYLFEYPNPRPIVQILGPVLSLEIAINALADVGKLTQEEREYLLELPNVDDDRPNYHITILKELSDAN